MNSFPYFGSYYKCLLYFTPNILKYSIIYYIKLTVNFLYSTVILLKIEFSSKS